MPRVDPSPALIAFIERVIQFESASRGRFSPLCHREIKTHPIPFFGDPSEASLITVGVNPSAQEFVGRDWPDQMTAQELTERLTGYFNGIPTSPHRWFSTWESALAKVGASCRTNTAHLDLSPRATIAMGSTDQLEFAGMIEHDIELFFEALPLCKRARALLLAGCVTKRWYANDFLRRVAPGFGFTLTCTKETRGEGRVCIERLEGPGITLPVFFCSVSPSARSSNLLPQRLEESAELLRNWIGIPLA